MEPDMSKGFFLSRMQRSLQATSGLIQRNTGLQGWGQLFSMKGGFQQIGLPVELVQALVGVEAVPVSIRLLSHPDQLPFLHPLSLPFLFAPCLKVLRSVGNNHGPWRGEFFALLTLPKFANDVLGYQGSDTQHLAKACQQLPRVFKVLHHAFPLRKTLVRARAFADLSTAHEFGREKATENRCVC